MNIETYQVTVFVGGDVATAKRWLREECYRSGLCVTVTPTTFVYTGGDEDGLAIGFVNYPRFPSTRDEIWNRAHAIATALVVALCQKTALVVATDRTEWIQVTPPGGRQ